MERRKSNERTRPTCPEVVARRLADDGAFPAARWIGRDAVRELTDPKTLARIGRMRSRRASR